MSRVIRAEHVGSLLRTTELLRAREDYKHGSISQEQLRAKEDSAILHALDRQRQIGLDVFTDGEFRRDNWAGAMADAVEGFVSSGSTITWRGPGGGAETSTVHWVVGGRLEPQHRLAGTESAFLRRHAHGAYKVTLPAPSNFYMAGWKPGVTDAAYADRAEMTQDVARILHTEVQALVDEGVRYIQLDAPYYCVLLEDSGRDRLRAGGVDPDQALLAMIADDNAVFDGLARDSLTLALHICRGNSRSRWLTEGGYDSVAETLFSSLIVNKLLLEYDSPRAGSFAPLRFVPRDKLVVLGLVTTKEPQIEAENELCRRINDAASYLPLEQLAISPQCGFASVAAGNLLSEDDQWRKLELVVQTARHMWLE